MLVLRMNLPLGGTLGSRESLKTGPDISLNASSSERNCSALVTIDRNLYMVNNRPCKPQRTCLNRMGPGEVSLMMIAVGIMTVGPKINRPMAAPRRAIKFFKIQAQDISGVDRNTSMGRP